MKIEKKQIIRVALFIATLVSLWFVPWILVKAWLTPLPDTVQEQANEAINYGFDGIIVYVDEVGSLPELYTAGWNDRDNEIPADPQALFKIGSISKLYIAAAITKLVSDGTLSLDKTLAEYLPELVGRIENAENITLRLMAQHRSGIPNLTDRKGFWDDPLNGRERSLELSLDLPAYFEPDSDYGYSNTNYLLLSMLIDRVVGYSHHEYIKEEILEPLALNSTFSSLSSVNIEAVMSGYYVGYEQDIKANDYGLDGYGSMVATAQDVGIFLRALSNGTLFNEREQDIYSSIYEYEHGGLVPGYQSLAEYHEDLDAVVIQFVNTTNFDGYNWNLSEIIMSRIVKILRSKNSRE